MKRCLVVLLCAVLLCSGVLTAGASAPDRGDPSALDAQVDRIFKGARTVGGSVAVYHQGQLVYARDYGLKTVKGEHPVDERTYFRLASVTKMVTGVGILRLVEAGKLDLDQDISQLLGFQVGHPSFPDQAITLRQLMSHTSSLRDEGGFGSERNLLFDLLSLSSRRYSNFENWEPGARYRYTNFGAGVAGAVLEAMSGQSLNALMKETLFDPLGVDAAYAAGLLQSPADVSSQYSEGALFKSSSLAIKEAYEDVADPQRHYRTNIGGLWMRSRDLARLMALLANGGELDGLRLLQSSSIQEMMQEQSSLKKSVTGDSPYGLFLSRETNLVSGHTFYGHQGMSTGAILNAYFEPESQFAIAIFSNGGSKTRDNRIGKMARAMIEYLFPLITGGD